jgi:[acyl-carrier-protein] S-malonyltransferase
MGGKSYKMDKIKNLTVVFPGQASQYVGMGKEFIESVPECADIIREGEKITALPLLDKIMNGPLEELTRTLICQPAVFGVSMVCWHILKKNGFTPSAVAGHSLGEYSALVASGVLTLSEGFYIVKKRAHIMDEISGKVDGSLMAVLGMKLSDVEDVLKEFPDIEVSNHNSDSQIVVGGKKEALEKLNLYLKQKRIKGIMLNVSGPFHTSLMKKAGELISVELDKLDFKDPKIPLYLNYSGEKAIDGQEVKEGLIKQISTTVRWLDIIKNIGEGVFVEVGPKKVLKRIIEGILPESKVFNVEDNRSLTDFIESMK